ncbi:MAG: DUF4157 domain-containing protein [Chitinophagaceae bacterium]
MPEKAPKISPHLPLQKKQQASFIQKKGEQTFFGPQSQHASLVSPSFIQPKLQMSQPGDPFEKEADQQADRVMRMSEPTHVATGAAANPPDENIQRKEDEQESVQAKMYVNGGGHLIQRMEEDNAVQSKEQEEEQIQRKEEDEQHVQPSVFRKKDTIQLLEQDEAIQPKTSYLARKDRGPPTVQPQFENNLHSNQSSGKHMDSHTQQFMESRFNADFSGVKIHTGSSAVSMSSNINAQAFTHGNNIYFNAGKYSPGTGQGRHLLAHELTHTIQQGAAKSVQPFLSTKLNTQTSTPGATCCKKEFLQLSQGGVVQLQEDSEETEDAVQPSMVQTKTQAPTQDTRPELKRSVAYAESQVGQVDANKKNPDGTRVGWEHLLDYYKTAMGDDKVIPDGGVQKPGSIMEHNIKVKGKPIQAQKPNQPDPSVTEARDTMPSWCGIFVFWSLNKGGIPMPKWGIGGNAVSLKAAYPKSYIPRPGDIAYFGTNSHYAIVEKTQPENPDTKDRKNVQVSTVNGNTTGENNLGGQIQIKTHKVSHWDGFFNPLYGLEDKLAKDPAAVSDAELQKILASAGAASAAGSGGSQAGPGPPAAITPYMPPAATSGAVAIPEAVTETPVTDAPKAAGKEGAPVVEEAVVEASPKSPGRDPAFQAVLGKTTVEKNNEKKHGTGLEKSATAQLASEVPKELDIDSQAQYHQVGAMNVQKAGTFNKEAFKAQLMERVKKALPKNDRQTLDMYEDNTGTHDRMEEAKANAKGDVKAEKDKAGNAIAATAHAPPNTALATPKVTKAMDAEDPGKQPYIPKAENAAPKPKTDGEISTEKDAQSLDDEMAGSNVTEGQLAKSNEPKFTGALDEKTEAQQQARNAPAEYRDQENPQLAKAKNQAAGNVQGNMAAIHDTKSGIFGKVDGSKNATKDKDAAKRKEISEDLKRLYTETKDKVDNILNALEKEVTDDFDAAANTANADFEKRVNDRLDDFYGITTVDDTISEWVSGIDPEINQIFTEERDRYVRNMDGAINSIAQKVETQLNAAMTEIATGKENIDTYWNKLDPETQKIGEAAKAEIDTQFEELEASVQEKHDALVEKLGDRYVENLGKLQETFDKIKESKQGLLSGALNAIKAVIETIIKLKDMLFETLARISQVVGDIISDPIGFLGNMVKAVGLGLHNFKENIVTHLKKGFFEWLMGNMPPGIEFPDKWDLTGIFKFIMQILGLTWTNIRMRAVKKLGEPVVAALEEVFEIFQIIRKEGLPGLWRFIKEKVGDLKVMVLDAIENFLIEKVVRAGIMWVIGLLNPAGAFVKACQAIYKIVMFFIDNGKRIMEFVNAVIDSIANIVAGNIGGAAKMVEDALARIIPLAIGFLASLLGLDGISEKVQKIIKAIQAPINKAIDWVLDKAIALAKKLGIDKLAKKVKGGIDKGKDWAKKKIEQGKKVVKKVGQRVVGSVAGWLGLTKEFTTVEGEKHKLYFKGTAANATLTIASEPKPLELFLQSVEIAPGDPNAGYKKHHKDNAIAKAAEIGRLKTQAVAGGTEEETKKNQAAKDRAIAILLQDIAENTKHLFGSDIPEAGEPEHNPSSDSNTDFGHYMKIKPLTRRLTVHAGSDPTDESHAVYTHLAKRRGGGSTYYKKGHLLNQGLKGTGSWKNLTPLTTAANGEHERVVESYVKAAVDTGAIVEYKVVANYTSSRSDKNALLAQNPPQEIRDIIIAEDKVPLGLSCEVYRLDNKLKRVQTIVSVGIANPISRKISDYYITGDAIPDVYLSDKQFAKISSVLARNGFDGDYIGLVTRKILQAYTKDPRIATYQKLADMLDFTQDLNETAQGSAERKAVEQEIIAIRNKVKNDLQKDKHVMLFKN